MTAFAFETVAAIAQKMRDRHVGCVVIVDSDQVAIGMITDRDLVIRVVAESLRLDVPIEHVMSRDVETVRRGEQLDDVVLAMRRHGVRRLPVVDDDGRLAGLVSLDDIEVLLAGELSASAAAIEENRGP